MALRSIFTALALVLVAACGDDDAETAANDATDATEAVSGPCEWVTSDDTFATTDLTIEGTIPQDQGCTWQLTESAATLEGPNEGEGASLSASQIDPDAFDEARDAADGRIDEIEDLGDDAYLFVADDESDTTLYVREGDAAFSLRLTGVLDGTNANTDALIDLSRTVLQRASAA